MNLFHAIRKPATVCVLALAAAACHAQAPGNEPQEGAAAYDAAPLVHPKPKPAVAASGATGPKAPAPKPPAAAPAPADKTTLPKPDATTPAKPDAATPTPVPFNRNVIVLDPAHGGADSGSRISDSVVEKDVTLALAFKLKSLLAARGLNVTLTRDADTEPTPLTLDDRAGLANHTHAAACLLLHATASGTGVHLYSSELDPTDGEPLGAPWLTAQSAWVTQSQRLQKQLSLALTRASIPLVQSRASVRPLDSLTCPALVLELSPNGADASSLTDGTYQQRVAEAIATALVFWQNQANPPNRLLPATTALASPGGQP